MPLTCPYCAQQGIPESSRRCPRCLTEFGPSGRLPTAPQKVDEFKFSGAHIDESAEPNKNQVKSAGLKQQKDSALPFRPLTRPPMVIVRVFDDGSQRGEEFRVRTGSFTIGRSEGNVIIPHDGLLSGKHVIIENDERNPEQWFVRDLNSKNGTFALIDEGILKPNQELLLGSNRYRFEPHQAIEHPKTPTRNATTAWQIPAASKSTHNPSIVQLTPSGDGPTFDFPANEFWLGASPSKLGIVLDDPFLSADHAHISLDKQNRWTIKAGKCLNGIWLRVSRIQITKSATFQIGEQRFSVRIP